MADQLSEFVVAARGWQHPHWRETFYPDDLPEDWRLSYYSNEFRAVVVPAEAWPVVSEADVVRWQEDTGDDFRFYLEVSDPHLDWDRLVALTAPIAGQVGGVLLRPAVVDAGLAELAPSLARARELGPLSVQLPPAPALNARGRRLLNDAAANEAWLLERGRPPWRVGPLAVAHTTDMGRTPRQWREVVEGCLREGRGCETLLLVLEGEAPDIEALRVASMIGDLLVPAIEFGL